MTAALRSGDAHSLTAIYDAYAGRLYDYAFGMLRDREAAEDAVVDALLVALDRISSLREPQRFTVWLYALTRNECLRQAKRSRVASRPRRVDSRDETVFFGADDLATEQARAWIRDATAGMEPRRREALDLTVRHGLAESDLVTVLGVSPQRVRRLVARAREDLDRTLDSLLTARAGHGECRRLDALLAGWDGRFDQDVHERVSAHTAGCRTCAAGASSRGGAADRFAELPAAPVPQALRERLLATAEVPHRVDYRGEIAEPFLRSGFPVPLEGYRRRRRALLWAGMLALLLAAVAGVWYILQPDGAPRASQGEAVYGTDHGGIGTPGTTSASATPSASPTASPTPSPSPKPSPPASRSRAVRPVPTAGDSDSDFQVDALLSDSTVGCPKRWRALATSHVRGAAASQVTFYWGVDTDPSRAVQMAEQSEGVYQAQVAGMPLDTPVYWRVVAVAEDGATSATAVNSTSHGRC